MTNEIEFIKAVNRIIKCQKMKAMCYIEIQFIAFQ